MNQLKIENSVKEQNKLLLPLLWPVRGGAFSIALLSNVFPLVAVFYLMIDGTSSMPWITRSLFVMLLVVWIRGIDIAIIWKKKAHLHDGLMVVFFCFSIIGYIRSGYPELTFQYFLFLNLLVFFLGRYSNAKECDSLVAYFFGFGFLMALAYFISLPEIYHQWKAVGAKHPMLYGVFGTAAGLDLTLGCLPVLAGLYIFFPPVGQTKYFKWLMHGCVALGMVLLILIASKSVILAAISTLIAVAAVQYKSWRRSGALLATLLASSIFALAIAPANNIEYYKLFSPDAWVNTIVNETAPNIVNETAPNIVNETADTGIIRIHLTLAALRQISNHPFLGVGAKAWHYDSPHPHNVLLETALMFGIPSFFALALFYLMSFWRLLIRPVGISEFDRARYASIAALLLFFLLYNLIQGQLASFRSLPLFLISGYAAAMMERQREAAER